MEERAPVLQDHPHPHLQKARHDFNTNHLWDYQPAAGTRRCKAASPPQPETLEHRKLRLHWVKDTLLREDASTIRTRNAPVALCALRNYTSDDAPPRQFLAIHRTGTLLHKANCCSKSTACEIR
jgi:hypothetical protein